MEVVCWVLGNSRSLANCLIRSVYYSVRLMIQKSFPLRHSKKLISNRLINGHQTPTSNRPLKVPPQISNFAQFLPSTAKIPSNILMLLKSPLISKNLSDISQKSSSRYFPSKTPNLLPEIHRSLLLRCT
jgi:hypothetical protein